MKHTQFINVRRKTHLKKASFRAHIRASHEEIHSLQPNAIAYTTSVYCQMMTYKSERERESRLFAISSGLQ